MATPATEDFLEGTLYDCAVANIVWSTIFAYDKAKMADGPKTMADFFDCESSQANVAFAKALK